MIVIFKRDSGRDPRTGEPGGRTSTRAGARASALEWAGTLALLAALGLGACDGGPPVADREAPPDGTADERSGERPGGAPPETRDQPPRETRDEPPEDTVESLPERFQGTAGIVDVQRPAARVAVLREVRVAEHAGFDRVVFEFSGPDAPGHHVEYIDRPVRRCGSGQVAPLAGDGWLEVRMSPVRAHTEEGRPTVEERERRPGLPVLLELELTCDFEAVVTWVLGVASPNRYRAVELADPPRLVIDVRH